MNTNTFTIIENEIFYSMLIVLISSSGFLSRTNVLMTFHENVLPNLAETALLNFILIKKKYNKRKDNSNSITLMRRRKYFSAEKVITISNYRMILLVKISIEVTGNILIVKLNHLMNNEYNST